MKNQFSFFNWIKTKGWKYFGKFSAVVFLIGGIIAIINAVPKIEVQLDVQGEYTNYNISTDIYNIISDVRKIQSSNHIYEELTSQLKRYNIKEYELTYFSDSLSNDFDKAWTYLDIDNIFNFRQQLSLNIVNRGIISAHDFILNLPISGTYMIIDSSDKITRGEFNKTIKIGDINAKDKYNVYIWTTYSNSSEKHYFTYDQGAGEIEFPFKTYGPIAFILNNFAFLIFTVCLILFVIISVIQIILHYASNSDKVSIKSKNPKKQ